MLLILPEFEDFFCKIFIFSRADVTYDLSLYFYLYYSHLLSHTDSFLLIFFCLYFFDIFSLNNHEYSGIMKLTSHISFRTYLRQECQHITYKFMHSILYLTH